MGVFSFICPICGTELETESTTKAMYCPHCEQRIDVQKIVADAKLEFEEERKSYFTLLEEYKSNGEEALRNQDYDEAIINYCNALELDKDNFYIALSILKAANGAIDNHYKDLESLYVDNPKAIDESGIYNEINKYLNARELALSRLDERQITHDMLVTPYEEKVEQTIAKNRKRHNIIRLISVVGSIAVVVGIIALAVIKF